MAEGQRQHLSIHVPGVVTCRQLLLLTGAGRQSKAMQKAGHDARGFCTGVNKCLGQGRLKAVLLSLCQPGVW